ncbi:hypothetical protein MNBD_ALPHA02-799 [hydrothermal vent metagenome]|uniref:Uncharacterized protein n=1 Tax=hydrothermal vent metagenome TaxID=652676 RepID=A0A3B0RWX4_9ZZZZ
MNPQEEKFNNFIKETQLEGMRLTGSEFFKNPEFDNYEFNELKKSLTFNAEDITADDDAIFIHVCWMLCFKKGNKFLVKIKVCYELAYSMSKYFDDEIVTHFVSRVVKPTTYPYLRQKINRISEDAYLGIPPLPMLKFLPTNSHAEEVIED